MTSDTPGHVTDEQLVEQLEYYSSRAPEYEDWWYRRGPFDRGEAENGEWLGEARIALQAMESLDLGRHALELAPGTGTWSVPLAERVEHLTLVDGSTAMLDRNPAANRRGVKVVVADLFTWTTDERFDSVVFAFWVSHVPEERLDALFFDVATWLRPGGSVFFVDDAPLATSEPHVAATNGQTMVRRLQDGGDATIVKNFFSAERLIAAADRAGIDLRVASTGRFFQYGMGSRRGHVS